MMRRWIIAFLIAVFVAACSGSPQAQSENIERDFAQILQTGVRYDYDPFDSPEAQRDAADLVVLGTITKVVPGRTLGDGRSRTQANLVVDVLEVVRGAAVADMVYVEIDLPTGVSAAELDDAAPRGRLLLFLDDRTDIDGIDGEEGRPIDASIYAPFVQGMIIETDGTWVSGMEDDREWGKNWHDLSSFDALVSALQN